MNGRPSIARALFDSIVAHTGHSGTVTMLRSMVNSTPPTVETEYLDFKGATQPQQGKPLSEKEVKSIWSEALAGFATTNGGVLVWGIDARKVPPNTVDQATDLNLVPDPPGMKSRLQQLLPQATDPPVPGVNIEAFPDPNEGGQGFVVCYVPESDYKPHRTEMGGKRYVMRIGDSFVDVPPPVLRSLFFPQRRSYIFIRIASQVKGTDAQSGLMKVRFSLQLVNEGPATATDLILLAQDVPRMQFLVPQLWVHHRTTAGHRYHYQQSFHPGEQIEGPSAAIDVPFVPRVASQMGWNGEIDFHFQLYATDQVPQEFTVHCTAEEIKQQHTWEALPQPVSLTRHR